MSLEVIKQRLSRKYLGRGGIHGIGMSKVGNAVRVHLVSSADPGERSRQSAILDELKRDAAPYEVIITFEEMPTKMEGARTER
jgi:hypothetical protein